MKRLWKRIGLIGLVFAAVLFGGIMSACGAEDKAPSQVSAETISYDGSTITWAAPAGKPTSYTVDVNGVQATTYVTSFPYSASSNTQTDTFTITIIAKNAKGESEPSSRLFTRLPSISTADISFDETGKMTWTSVPGAMSYLVKVKDVESPAMGTEFSDFLYDNNRNAIQIKPVGPDGTFSSWSEAVYKTYLSAPTDIEYDGTNLRWMGNYSAEKYSVYINGSKHADATSTSLVYNSNNRNFTVAVQSLGDGVNSFSSKLSDEEEFIFLGAVQNVHVESGELVWDAVQGAELYEVSVDGVISKQTETRFKLTAGGNGQNVKIRPLGREEGNYFSSWSAEETYIILTPPQLRWNDSYTLDGERGQNINWDPVNQAVGSYTIRYEAPDRQPVEVTMTDTQTYFEYDYLTPGTYKVSVRTNARTGSGYYDSAFSAEAEIIRLAPPQMINQENFITSDPTDLSKGFTVQFNAGDIPGATSYALWKEGRKVSSGTTVTNTQIKVNRDAIVGTNYQEEQDFSFGIQSIGSPAVSQNRGLVRKVLDSLSGNNLPVEIKVLPVPGNLDIEGQRASWGAVAGTATTGYGVLIDTIYKVPNAHYDLDNVSPGTHTLSVCAAGDGHGTLASDYSAAVKVTKLQAPTGLYIASGEQGGRIAIREPSDNAKSYNLYFNGSEEPTALNAMQGINHYVTQTTVTVIARAIADYWDDAVAKTEYFLSSDKSASKQFTKLAPVTFPTRPFTDTEFIWEAPSNANNTALVYQVYDSDNLAFEYASSSTSQDISSLKPGTYLFGVVALNTGHEDEFISSELAQMDHSVVKPKAPVISRTKTSYTWNGVGDVENYIVRVQGEVKATIRADSGSKYEYIPDFSVGGDYQVTVTAAGDGINVISTTSDVLTQTVKQLQRPTFTGSYSKTCYSTTGRLVFTVNEEKSDKNTTGYIYKANGVVSNKMTETTYQLDPHTTGRFELTVVAVGREFDEDGIYYIDSQEAERSTITLLSAPNVGTSDVTLSSGGRISWPKVENSDSTTKYKLIVHFSDGTQKEQELVSTNSMLLDLDGHDVKDIVSVEFQAVGNGTTTISSQVVTWNR